MEFEQLVKLINTVSASWLTEFKYEENGVKIEMKKEAEKAVCTNDVITTIRPGVVRETVEADVESQENAGGNIVKSPLVGTFYVAPAEDAAPFVSVGDTVKRGQPLAIVEAMKLMNEIESEFDGVVAEVFVENGQAVEYGQPLFRIE